MRASLLLLPLLIACTTDEGRVQMGTTLADDGGDADYDGVGDAQDCDPGNPDVYPGAYDAPGDGLDADCDGEDPLHMWVGDWDIVDVQAVYSTYPILSPGGSEGTLEIREDGEAILDAQALLDPALIGLDIDIYAGIEQEGIAAPQARADQVMLYLEGDVIVPTYDTESSFVDMLCTVEGEEMYCKGTLKALGTTLDTDVWLER